MRRPGLLLAIALLSSATLGGQRRSDGRSDIQIRLGITSSADNTRVESVPLEDYVARVVAGEGQPRAPDAAQQALAIAVRTFALANRNRHRSDGFDLCDTTHCQVVRRATPSTTRAALATAGKVLVHQGEPAMVFYSAWCGGHSELASEVWPGAIDHAFEPSQHDEACRDEPEWASTIDRRDLEQALRAAGLRGDRLRDLRVVDRNASGRVTRLRADGFTPAEISGIDFRMAVGRLVGWQTLKSTAFELGRASGGYEFTGRGYGHGVGLCVIGAGNRASNGATADEILRFYYPGLRVDTYPARSMPTAAPRAADVLLALPAREENERALVMELIRRTRDEIAAKTGVPAPTTIRVTIHPTVESFGRATGQPWWVSGTSQAGDLDLLPLATLRQRGQLERTIRHEMAHVLLDATFAKRPAWVREGAAFYFGDSSPGAARLEKTTCPTDEELLRPVSAGAQRDGFARAEACFRRQIAEGKNWRDVK